MCSSPFLFSITGPYYQIGKNDQAWRMCLEITIR
jgi:hypothetical protein